MFQVLENNTPCDCQHRKVDKSWNKSKFNTFEEAVEYAVKWFYPYGPAPQDYKPNTPIEYYEGCVAEIREVK